MADCPRIGAATRGAGPLGMHANAEKSVRPGLLGLDILVPGLPTTIQRLVSAQNAAMRNPAFAPDPTSGTTHCSEAAWQIDKAMGGQGRSVLGDPQGNNYPANVQIEHLANPLSGYRVVSPARAQALANLGVTVWATQLGGKHGHIASVRPEGVPADGPRGASGPLLANVGLFNGVAHQSAVFTPAHGAIHYYAPSQ